MDKRQYTETFTDEELEYIYRFCDVDEDYELFLQIEKKIRRQIKHYRDFDSKRSSQPTEEQCTCFDYEGGLINSTCPVHSPPHSIQEIEPRDYGKIIETLEFTVQALNTRVIRLEASLLQKGRD